MQKIPTLFQRDPEDFRRLLHEVHPDCEWVLNGEGVATRKYDGTCVMLDGDGMWWARREVKPGKPTPPGFVPVHTDDTTGKTVGWELVENSSFAKTFSPISKEGLTPGTYELCGPKVNKNPEGFGEHVLVSHAQAEQLPDAPRHYDDLAVWLKTHPYEGIVWHHADGRMAKIKARDFA